MSLATLTAHCAAVAAALQQVAASATEATGQVKEFVSVRDKLQSARAERNANTLDALLNGPATSAVTSMYIEELALNPNSPHLPRMKNFLRQFARVDESFFSLAESLFKRARREFDRTRGNRGKRLDQGIINGILDEISGRD